MNDLTIPYASLEYIQKEKSPVALNFSIPYNVAVLLIDKELTPKQFTEERILDPKVHELAKKVRIVNDISTSMDILEALPSINIPSLKDIIRGKFSLKDANLEKIKVGFGAKVKIQLKNGKVLRAAQKTPLGSPGNYVPLENKYRQEATAIKFPEEKIQNAIALVDSLEELSNIRELVGQFTFS